MERSLISREKKSAAAIVHRQRDTESGLDYFGARYYSNGLGRFLSPDWESKPDPVPYASLEDPQSLNLYSYVGNDPLAHADSDGHIGKQFQLSGKFTARLDKSNPNDMPNVHVFKNGNEIARGKVNPETNAIEWTGNLGASIRNEAETLAREKGLFEAAQQRLADIQARRAAGTAAEEGEAGGGVASRALIVLQLIGIVADQVRVTTFNEHTGETGLKMDAFGGLHVADLTKVTSTASIGSQILVGGPGGQTYTLGADRQWRNSLHQKVDLCQGKSGDVHECGA